MLKAYCEFLQVESWRLNGVLEYTPFSIIYNGIIAEYLIWSFDFLLGRFWHFNEGNHVTFELFQMLHEISVPHVLVWTSGSDLACLLFERL